MSIKLLICQPRLGLAWLDSQSCPFFNMLKITLSNNFDNMYGDSLDKG